MAPSCRLVFMLFILSRCLRYSLYRAQRPVVLVKRYHTAAIWALCRGVNGERRTAARAGYALHGALPGGHGALRAAHIPFVGHKLLAVPVAGDQLLIGILHGVIHYPRAELDYEMLVAALLVEPSEVHAKHRYAIHMVGESPALEAVELPFHLGKEGVRKVRPEGFYILIRPAVLHLHVQVAVIQDNCMSYKFMNIL